MITAGGPSISTCRAPVLIVINPTKAFVWLLRGETHGIPPYLPCTDRQFSVRRMKVLFPVTAFLYLQYIPPGEDKRMSHKALKYTLIVGYIITP